MRLIRAAAFAVCVIVASSGCDGLTGGDDNSSAGNPPAIEASADPLAGVDTLPSSATSQDPGNAKPSSLPPTPTASAKTVDESRGEKQGGVVLSTAVTTIDCGDQPVSGFYTESKFGSDKAPYGDVDLGHNNQAHVIRVTHSIEASTGMWRPNIGCGYVSGGDNDWKYEFSLPAISGGANTIKCDHKACTVNGKNATLR